MPVPNNMDKEIPTVYEYDENNTRLQHLSLDLPTFIEYLKAWQDNLKRRIRTSRIKH